jgi:hypothetical protein
MRFLCLDACFIAVILLSSFSLVCVYVDFYLLKRGKMSNRRTKRRYSRRISEGERQAYLQSLHRQPPVYLQPQPVVRRYKGEEPAPLGCYIPLLILVLLIGFIFFSSFSHTNVRPSSTTVATPIATDIPINDPASFCSTSRCMPPTYPAGNGYTVPCSDGTYSHAGGKRGACSHHGGERRP